MLWNYTNSDEEKVLAVGIALVLFVPVSIVVVISAVSGPKIQRI